MQEASPDQFRAECEARYWLKVTRGKKELVDSLMGRIAAKRGQSSALALRDLMRLEWERLRREH